MKEGKPNSGETGNCLSEMGKRNDEVETPKNKKQPF